MATVTFADAELVACHLLGSLGNWRTVTDLPPAAESLLPIVQVTRIGGPVATVVFDRPTVQVDFYAASRAAANDMAREGQRLWLHVFPGQYTAECVVSATSVISGPSRRPNANPGLFRVGFLGELTLKAR